MFTLCSVCYVPELEEEELDGAEVEAEEAEDAEEAEAAPESEYAEPLNAVNLDVNQSVSYLDDEALNMEFDDAQEQFLDEVEEADYTIVSKEKQRSRLLSCQEFRVEVMEKSCLFV
jgi:hypothetical protein